VWSTLSAVKLHGERGASNGSSRSSRESAGRRWSTRYERGRDEVKGEFIGRDKEKEVASQKRRMEQGEKEERFFVVKKERETRFDVLLWSSRARRRGGRQNRSYSDITLASLRSYCHATVVKWTEHLLASLTCKENFGSDETNTTMKPRSHIGILRYIYKR